jgi:microcystin-dependent protein
MSESFVGEIRMFAGNFAPRGWALCDGQLLAVSSNDALFSLVGTIYGGDGRTTFGLPDLRGRIPVHPGSGPGLTDRRLGQKEGSEETILSTSQLPVHKHVFTATNNDAAKQDPTGSFPARAVADVYKSGTAVKVDMSPSALSPAGESRPHNNMMPFLCLNFIISLYGVYPSRH